MRARIIASFGALALAPLACTPSPQSAARSGDSLTSEAPRLPNGLRLDPAGASFDVGSMPLAIAAPPERDRVVLLLNGYNEQGLQIVDRNTGRVLQTAVQPAAFLGLVFSPDRRTLYASGGNQDVVYTYAWWDGAAMLSDSIVLAPKARDQSGTRYPAGIGLSPDGATMYVAENLADSLAVVDLASGRVTARFATERYPYGVAVTPEGRVFVSAWGGNTLSIFDPAPGRKGALTPRGRLTVARHPSALLLNADGSRLFVASGSTDRVVVVDTRTRQVLTALLDPPPAGPAEGSTPNALALSADGTRLFVAEGDNNAVAVFDLAPATANVATATGTDALRGRIPVQWYPTALLALGDSLVVVNGKGRRAGPNPNGPTPATGRSDPHGYTLGQLSGTLTIVGAARASTAELEQYSQRVARANGWGSGRAKLSYPPFHHVIYIIKENRTYDQVFSDLPQGDGDTSLLFFPRPVSPNHHALAERFGLFDRFFVNAEVSPDGHNWSMAAYATDYVQKTVPTHYSQPDRGRTYDYEGTNRDSSDPPEDDVAEPANGYLWNLAQRGNLSFRNYGEFVVPADADPAGAWPAGYRGLKPFLAANTNPRYAGFDMSIPDQRRADVWLADLAEFTRRGEMPRLQILRLPNDHTSGARAGNPTPPAYMADNDLALGRIIEALSRSPFWKSTVVFVLEDDAQNGPDHVDSHRSLLLVISPYNRPGVHHRFANTTDVLLTIEDILGLSSLSQFDFFGRPLRDIFASSPDLTPYSVLTPSVSLDERNPAGGWDAEASARLDLRFEDVADEDQFNRILWRVIKGHSVPYPGIRRITGLEMKSGY